MQQSTARAAGVGFCLSFLVLAATGCSHRVPSTARAGPGGLAVAPSDPGRVEPFVQPGPAQAPGAAPDTTSNIRLTQLGGWPEAETTIAVNPIDPLNLVAGARTSPVSASRDHFYTSLDGGETWTEGILPVPFGFDWVADPVVAFCGDGSAYYTMLARVSGSPSRSGIFVHRSTDGGLTWPTLSTVVDRTSEPIAVSDKPWMTCDTTNSTFAGRIYVAYTDPLLVPSGSCTALGCRAVKVHRSVDNGATWSLPVMVSANPQAATNQASLAVGPSGELYVAWNWGANYGDNFGSIKVDKSTNGGVSFGADIVASSFVGIYPDGYVSRYTYPIIDVDRGTGPYQGYVYIAFSDLRNGDPDVLFVRSTNGGATWSPPIRVNDDALHNLADQWGQTLAVDPLGRIIVTFYDRRRFIGSKEAWYEVWGAISRDGGATFDTNFLVSDTPSNTTVFGFLGDYDSVAVTADRLYPLWADLRTSALEAFDTDIYTDAFRNTFRYDEVKGVLWISATDMGFVTQDARFGVDLDYDVVGGLLSELRADHGFVRAACVAPLWPTPPLVDPRVPPELDGYYYLVRVHGPAGVGTYGDGPPARPNVRDPLNETLATCP